MTKTEFLQQANPMMQSVDAAMAQIFGRKQQTLEEIQAKLEREEDEFIARKEAEAAECATEDAADEDALICASCNGSGEGQYDGTRCISCKGRGTEMVREEA